MRPLRLLAVVTVLAILAAACGDDDDTTAATTTTATPTTESPTTTGSPTTTAPATTTTAEPSEWVAHETDDECMCADGSDYWIHSRTADPEKVVLYFQGGGACFAEWMCQFEGGTYKVTTGPDDHPGASGIFDFDDPDNPLADWSFVHVPYCTGDVHIGDATTEYGELTVEHNGFVNASHGLQFLVDTFPGATEIVVSGSSAGGVPSPLFGGLVSDAFPDAEVGVLADASGGYPSNPPTNGLIGGLWGILESVPDWPELDDVTTDEYGIPDLFRIAGQHDPDIRMARFDNAWDEVQIDFSAFAGLDGGLLAVLGANEAAVEAAGVDLDVYIAPGYNHTILGRPDLYDLEVEGVAFLDWLTTFVEGGDPGDVRCLDCGPEAPPEDDDEGEDDDGAGEDDAAETEADT